MAGPWEKYQTATASDAAVLTQAQDGPWGKYAQAKPAVPFGRPKQTLDPLGGQALSPFLPIGLGLEGRPELIVPPVITDAAKGLWDAVNLPGDVATGKTSVFEEGPDGRPLFNRETMQRATGLATLATGRPAGSRAVTGRTIPETPTAEVLHKAGAAGFDKARDMGVEYASSAVKSMADNLAQTLEADGIIAEVTPQTFAILKKLQSPPEDSFATLSNLIAARRALQNGPGANFQNNTEREAARRAIDAIDDFLVAPPAEGVMAGPAAAAGRIVEEARGNTAAGFRSDRLTRAEEKADIQAGATHSGLNYGNQAKQRLAAILDPTRPKNQRGYSQEELEFMRQIVKGRFGDEAARRVGNLLGGGGGLGQAITVGGAGAMMGDPIIGGAVGAGIYGAGLGSRLLYNKMVKNKIGALDEMIRQRSPLYQEMLKSAPLAAENPTARAAFLRSLLLMLGVEEVNPKTKPKTKPAIKRGFAPVDPLQ